MERNEMPRFTVFELVLFVCCSSMAATKSCAGDIDDDGQDIRRSAEAKMEQRLCGFSSVEDDDSKVEDRSPEATSGGEKGADEVHCNGVALSKSCDDQSSAVSDKNAAALQQCDQRQQNSVTRSKELLGVAGPADDKYFCA